MACLASSKRKLGKPDDVHYGAGPLTKQGEVVHDNSAHNGGRCVSCRGSFRWHCGRAGAGCHALGTWFTGDKESQVRIVNCGGALCGNLVWLKEPNDPATGRPKTDKNNADASKQGRPLLGVPVVLAMKPSGPSQWSGEVYNAEEI